MRWEERDVVAALEIQAEPAIFGFVTKHAYLPCAKAMSRSSLSFIPIRAGYLNAAGDSLWRRRLLRSGDTDQTWSEMPFTRLGNFPTRSPIVRRRSSRCSFRPAAAARQHSLSQLACLDQMFALVS